MTRVFGDLPRILVIGGLLVASAATTAFAADPLDAIKTRQQEMKKVGGAMKVAAAFLKDGKGSAADVATGAATIQTVAKDYANHFPEGTAAGVGDSEALPALWGDMPKFKTDLAALDAAAGKLAVAAASADKDAMGKAMNDLGGTCKQCHDAFRLKK